MIQDIYPHEYKNQYTQQKPEKEDYILLFEESNVIWDIEENGEKNFFKLSALEKKAETKEAEFTYLFSIDQAKFFLGRKVNFREKNTYASEHFQTLRSTEPMWKAFAYITGFQLNKWYMENRYCSKCGHGLVHAKTERALVCEKCNRIVYPKISPAVIVGVTDGNRILMSRYAAGDYKKYALLAGFTEIGETLEQTVEREVMEEVGLKVKDITYYKNQPWSFSDTMLVGFFAKLDGSDEIHIDETELKDARWMEKEEIPINPSHISLTNEMIEYFRNN